MTETAKALYSFWSGFGLPAYTTTTVPREAQLPYITYSLVETEPLQPATHYAQVFYRDTSNAALLAKVDEIKAALGDGVMIPCTGGLVSIRPDTPFVQIIVDAVPENRYAYINLQINCYHT